jgi:hypothetical protein
MELDKEYATLIKSNPQKAELFAEFFVGGQNANM